jgi:hypothetical protein
MIEWQRLLPIEDRVATLTVPAEPSEVRVLFRMAGRADCRRRPVLVAIAMTGRTRSFGMSADQWIISEIVIEPGSFEGNQAKFATVVFAVTCLARLRLSGRFAMKSLRFLDVKCDPLVT